MSAAGWRPRRKRSASKSIRALPPPKCCSTTTARSPASPPATWASARTAQPKDCFTRGMELRAKYTLFAEGARGSLGKQLIAKFALGDGREPQKFGLGLKELWQVAPDKHRKGLVQHTVRLAARQLAPAAARSSITSTTIWCRSASSCTSTTPIPICRRSRNSSASRRIRWCATLRGRQAARLWRARHHRRRLSVGAEAGVPRRRADRLRGRLHERAAHQGQPQRHAVRHAGGRGRRRGARRPAAPTTSLPTTTRPGAPRRSAATCGRCATPSRCGRDSARSSASRSAASTCGRNTFRLLAVRHAQARQARLRHAQARRRMHSRSPIPSPTASSLSTGCPRCSCPTPITRRTSRSHLKVTDMALQKASEHDVYAGPSARYCPAGVYEWVEEGGRAAVRDQRAELRPLQNLRHQGPEPEHHLGSARRRRRAELSEYVTACRGRGHDAAISGLSSCCSGPRPPFLRGRRKKAILGATPAAHAC